MASFEIIAKVSIYHQSWKWQIKALELIKNAIGEFILGHFIVFLVVFKRYHENLILIMTENFLMFQIDRVNKIRQIQGVYCNPGQFNRDKPYNKICTGKYLFWKNYSNEPDICSIIFRNWFLLWLILSI